MQLYLESQDPTLANYESLYYLTNQTSVRTNNFLSSVATTTDHDNAICLEWRIASLASGATWTFEAIERFSEKTITDLTVTAPLNETISAGQTKDITFNVLNNSGSAINNIALTEIIDLAGWTVNVTNPSGTFNLSAGVDQDVTVEIYCPGTATEGDISQVNMTADNGTETADDKAYIEVVGSLPGVSAQPSNENVCSNTDAASFSVSATNATGYQWQEYISSWNNISNGGVYSGATTNTLSISSVNGLVGNQYRCIVSNGIGDVNSAPATIIGDTEAPVITSTHSNQTVNANANCEAILADYTGDVTATDNCSYSVSQSPVSGTTISGTTNSITLTATDNMGNTDDVNFNVEVADNTAPIADIITLTNITEECEVTSLTAPTATDNCAGSIDGTHNATLPITSNTTIIWTYEDPSGNSVTQEQNVIIDDTTAPTPDTGTLTDITAECEVTSLTAPTATDNCGGTVTVTHNAILPITTNTTIIWTYEDPSGNSAIQNQVVIIDDTTAPTPDIGTLTDITAECEVTSLTNPTATDNCGGTVTVTHNAILPITTNTTIIWTYEDESGNQSTQNQGVIINDNTAPIPDETTLNSITEECEVTSLTAPTATDNCNGTVTITNNITLPLTSSTTITWTYEDENGNQSTQNQEVIIDDNTAPVVDNANLPTLLGDCSVNVTEAPSATDNCVGEITGTTTDPTAYNEQGTFEIIWSFDDGSGNITTQTQNVVVLDETAPVEDVASLEIVTSSCSAEVVSTPTATDGCSGNIIGTTSDPLTYEDEGTYTINWIFEDAYGNQSTQTQTVIVEDVAPIVETQNITIVLDEEGNASITYTEIDNGSYDDCGIDVIELDITEFTTNDIGENIVVLTVTDLSGNISTKEAIVTVEAFPVQPADLKIPNFISPDGNGKNDIWEIEGIDHLTGYNLNIFNKIGEVIYQAEEYDNTWNGIFNGNELPEGTYYYIFAKGEEVFSGFITIIR